MQPQVFDLLVHLLKNRDRVVSRDDLIALVWGGRIVSDSTLDSRINAARNAIGDNGKEQKLIRTIPRKGIRFVGAVDEQSDSHPPDCRPAETRHEAAAHRRLALPDRPAIAVLPFNNMSGDPEQEYFSDGISEDIITALSKLRWFFVIARNSSFTYKGKAVHIEAGRRRARRALRRRGQRAQERRSRPHHRAAQRHRDRQPHLGGALRPRPDRRVRGAGRDHRRHRRRDRAADLCGGKFSQPAQAAQTAWTPGTW